MSITMPSVSGTISGALLLLLVLPAFNDAAAAFLML